MKSGFIFRAAYPHQRIHQSSAVSHSAVSSLIAHFVIDERHQDDRSGASLRHSRLDVGQAALHSPFPSGRRLIR